MYSYNSQSHPELLQAYYRRIFPHKLFHRWLSYGNIQNGYFERREFSFTLSGDVYVRYQSFSDCNELEKAIVSRNPEKIDIGAVYNIKPKDSKSISLVAFKAEERELVFDIDMTDYDDVRTCCKGADICPKCWPFMIIAAKILERALRVDFGFQHMLWVYSGRRGIHCWVADERARKLSGEARSAIAEYLSVIEGGEFKAKKVSLDSYKIHPSLELAIEIINNHFDNILKQQNFLETTKQINAIIDLCTDFKLKQKLKTELFDSSLKNSVTRWERLDRIYCLHENELKKSRLASRNRHFVEELKLQFCYPRLDINVTKGVNHLLKTPFSVHPKTGRVCVPIDFEKIDSFDPFKVPTVSLLCKQMDESKSATTGRVYENTELFDSILVFKKFVDNIHKDFKGLRIEMSDQSMDF
ncbi:DNA primase small subunit-like [Oppia nitens]|uniref:DNA primase small subunit-like n=1 Tax=Oppia nitens TaxID=1686743 RepID=UPI0023DC650C|nr:DNA primase small subunit-like [Oppia nitens]